MKMTYQPKQIEEQTHPNKQWPQWLAVLSASLNFFATGLCFCWSSPSLAILKGKDSPFPITEDEGSWIVSFLPIGCAVGPLIGAYLARYLGPKNSTIISAAPILAGFILIIFATGPQWLYISRFLSGIGIGVGQTASPIYVAEIAENHNRGALMSFFLLWMAVGALFISCIGPYVSLPVMGGICAIAPLILMLTLPWFPDSPYYLARIGKEEKAWTALKWFRRQKNDSITQEEMNVVRKTTEENVPFLQSIKCLKEKPNPKAILIVNVTFLTQQLCGALVVMFYQQEIYERSNVPLSAEVAVIISSVIGNIAGIASMLVVDRWGRKPLLLISALGCAVSTGLLGTYLFLEHNKLLGSMPNANWTPVVTLNALQVFFSFGLSGIPSTQLGEIFSSDVKEVAFCGFSVIAALEGFIMTKGFQIVTEAYGLPTVFWALSSLTLVLLFVMYSLVPETKGKSFLEIQKMLCTSRTDINDNKDIKLQEIERY